MIISSSDFPILKETVNGKNVVYLDSAATSLKPQSVVEAEGDYYQKYCANVHRGIYSFSEKATGEYEDAREKVAQFIGANSASEVILVRNTTEAINIVAHGWGEANIKEDDQIITSVAEHHSNLVPWQQLGLRKKAEVLYLDITDDGQTKIDQLERLLSNKTKLVAISHVSNVLGTVNLVKKICQMAHRFGALVLVDGAQAVPHMKVNMRELGCDFYVFSGHKMLGPTGIGVLWGKEELMENMPPVLFGGGMISQVTLAKTRFADLPQKFEAGTPNIAGAIGLKAAIAYLTKVGMDKIAEHGQELTRYALEKLGKLEGVKIFGPKDCLLKAPVIAFSVARIHPHDLASILDQEGIAIRAGHHCCMPLHERLGTAATARASFYLYTTTEDIDKLANGIIKAHGVLK